MKPEQLYKIIKNRQKNMPKRSYVASLFKNGKDRIIQKLGEEVTEVVIAAKNKNKQRQIEEISDLIFHLLVLMAQIGINPENIYKELEKRHVEKS
jgi:phosphoribosyl-ATP pyrophosphohydrolase